MVDWIANDTNINKQTNGDENTTFLAEIINITGRVWDRRERRLQRSWNGRRRLSMACISFMLRVSSRQFTSSRNCIFALHHHPYRSSSSSSSINSGNECIGRSSCGVTWQASTLVVRDRVTCRSGILYLRRTLAYTKLSTVSWSEPCVCFATANLSVVVLTNPIYMEKSVMRYDTICNFPSMLWRCLPGDRKGIRPVKISH